MEMNQIKVLQISTGYDIEYNGGITNYVRNISENLILLNVETVVLDSTTGDLKKNFKFDRKKIKNLKLKPFNYNSVLNNEDSEAVFQIIKDVKPDIVHIHMMLDLPLNILEKIQTEYLTVISLHDYSWFCNRISLRDIDNKNCLDSSDGARCNICINKFVKNKYTNYLISNNQFLKKLSKKFPDEKAQRKLKYMKEIFQNFDYVIAVSNRVKEIYQKNGFQNQTFKVNHIGNITAEEKFRNKFIELDKKFIKQNKDYTLGFIGNFCDIKGASLIVELSKIIKNKIIIFGRISNADLEKISGLSNINYMGAYTQNELENILEKIDIGLVFPTWEDNAPQVVFEMQNALIPIIGTRMGGVPDFIQDGINGVLISPDEEGLKKAKLFLESSNLNLKLNKYKEKLKKGTKTPEQHSKEILEIYKGLVANEKFKK